MKINYKFYAILVIVCLNLLLACSEESTISNVSADKLSLNTPTNEVLAKSLDELSKNISNSSDSKIVITQIDYWDVPNEVNGFVAEVDYLNSEKELKKVLIVRNISKINFESGSAVSYVPNSNLLQDDIYITCSGPGCCYPSGTLDMNTGVMTTSCKCEGNPDQNSSCVMKISKNRPRIEE